MAGLARQARVLAAVGNCAAMRMVVRRIADVNLGYHDRFVAVNPALEPCW